MSVKGSKPGTRGTPVTSNIASVVRTPSATTDRVAWTVVGQRFRPLVLIVPLLYVLIYPLYKLFDPIAIVSFGVAAITLCAGLTQLFYPQKPMSRVGRWATQTIIALSVLALAGVSILQAPSLVPKAEALDRSCRALQIRMLRVNGDEPAATAFQALGCRPLFVRRPSGVGMELRVDGSLPGGLSDASPTDRIPVPSAVGRSGLKR